MTHRGGCLCGRIRYRIDVAPGPAVYCHCRQCRKAQGVAFAANAPVPTAAFKVVAGAAELGGFRSSADKTRYFCSVCGSPLYSQLDGAAHIRLRLGSLDDCREVEAAAHIFVASKADWVTIEDDLPCYAEREPGRA